MLEEQELQPAVVWSILHVCQRRQSRISGLGMWKALEGGDSEGFTAWDLQNEAGQG